MDDKAYIYYVVTDRKVKLMPNISAVNCRRYESVVGVDLYWGCERFSELSERKKLGHIDVVVYDWDKIQFGARLEKKSIEKKYIKHQIKSFSKYVLGNTKIKCVPKPVKN